jgi:type II secretory pathway component PulF
MAENVQIPKRDAEQERKQREIDRKTWPTYKKPSYLGSYLILLLFLAIAGVIVYYVLYRKEQASMYWNRITHRDRVPAQVEPGQ